MTFEGFPEQALVFYEGLRADNTKAYWTDHKATYDAVVKAPMEALLTELEPEFGRAKFFRPYRDVRFSKDKTPYKDHAAAVIEGGNGTTGDGGGEGALYVQLSADGIFVGGGFWHTRTDQAQRLRAAIAEDRSGGRLEAMLAGLDGFEVSGERLKRLPKPWESSHPRADLLHHKALTAGRSWEPAEWMHSRECLDRVAGAWRAITPLNAWLSQHVGPTRTPDKPHN